MDRTGDSRKNKREVANETNVWSCILWSTVSSDPLFLIPSKEITGWGEGELSTCPIPSGVSFLSDRQYNSCPVCLQDIFASLRFSKPGGTQVIWHTPLWEILSSSASPGIFQERLSLPRVMQQSQDVNLGSVTPDTLLFPQCLYTACLTAVGSYLCNSVFLHLPHIDFSQDIINKF